jgi:hypothetical protein
VSCLIVDHPNVLSQNLTTLLSLKIFLMPAALPGRPLQGRSVITAGGDKRARIPSLSAGRASGGPPGAPHVPIHARRALGFRIFSETAQKPGIARKDGGMTRWAAPS